MVWGCNKVNPGNSIRYGLLYLKSKEIVRELGRLRDNKNYSLQTIEEAYEIMNEADLFSGDTQTILKSISNNKDFGFYSDLILQGHNDFPYGPINEIKFVKTSLESIRNKKELSKKYLEEVISFFKYIGDRSYSLHEGLDASSFNLMDNTSSSQQYL